MEKPLKQKTIVISHRPINIDEILRQAQEIDFDLAKKCKDIQRTIDSIKTINSK